MANVNDVNEEANVTCSDEVFEVEEKKHPIRDFFANHPTISAIAVGIIAGLGGYAIGSNFMIEEDNSVDMDYDPDNGKLTIIDTTSEEVTE